MDTLEPERRDAAVGDEVALTLPGRSGGGYLWSVASVGDGLEVLSQDLQVAEPERGSETAAPGSPAHYILRLRTVRAGEWPVRLRLAREWESAPLEERVFVILVV